MRKILAALMLGGIALASACGSNADKQEQAADETPTPVADPVGGASMGCVEEYSLETLTKREYAFDGTIKSIDPATDDGPDRITFTVTKWFKGGQGAEVVRRAYPSGVVTSAGAEPREAGDHLLVAGDDDFLWECGFTQRYDAAVAADWARTLEA